LNAAVHFMVDERAKVLIGMGSFGKPVSAAVMAGHDGHILQMAFAAFIADRAVVGMIDHEGFHIARPEPSGFGRFDREAKPVNDGLEAGHDEFPFFVFRIFIFEDGALAAGAYGMQRGVPAKVRQVQSEG
jgi:hypothetical protein